MLSSRQIQHRIDNYIKLINKAVRKFQQPHALCNGIVQVKPPQASFTFVEMTDPNTYLHKLMSNETLKHGILRNLTLLVKLMSNTARDLFPEILRNIDLIETLGGKCFKILERRFIDTPLKKKISKKCLQECLLSVTQILTRSSSTLKWEFSIHSQKRKYLHGSYTNSMDA